MDTNRYNLFYFLENVDKQYQEIIIKSKKKQGKAQITGNDDGNPNVAYILIDMRYITPHCVGVSDSLYNFYAINPIKTEKQIVHIEVPFEKVINLI